MHKCEKQSDTWNFATWIKILDTSSKKTTLRNIVIIFYYQHHANSILLQVKQLSMLLIKSYSAKEPFAILSQTYFAHCS